MLDRDHASELAQVKPGESVVIYGAGAVRLMAADPAMLKAASQIWMANRQPDRLEVAEDSSGLIRK